jgi:hypothetical protein
MADPIRIHERLKCGECGGQFVLGAGDLVCVRLDEVPSQVEVHAFQQVFRPLVERGCVIVLALPGWEVQQLSEETMALAGWMRIPGTEPEEGNVQ